LSGPSRPLLDPSKRKPIEEYLKLQGRFKRMTPEKIRELERYVELNWEWVKHNM
jgi:pyruvate ferredoxin oxidoreductase beta subunit